LASTRFSQGAGGRRKKIEEVNLRARLRAELAKL
jgi:hypothetical protein